MNSNIILNSFSYGSLTIFVPRKLVSQSRAKVAALEVVAEVSVSKELREARSYSQQQSQGHRCGRGMSM